MLYRVPLRAVAFTCLFALALSFFPFGQSADDANASARPQAAGSRSIWLGPNAMGVFVRKQIDGRAVCLGASLDQVRRLRERNSNLSVLDPAATGLNVPPGGLRIILRGTSQLQSFPQAQSAYLRAAIRWERLIHTAATVVIDVDFGPTLFGKPYDDTVIGSTDTQVLQGNALYPAIRARLNATNFDPDKAPLYTALPARTVPTDKGNTAGMTATSATLRALGLINPVADLNAESNPFGPPPAIGLNSNYKFDFNPDDGIDADKLDFEAIALHEIGHVLGLVSFVGEQEMDAAIGVAPSPWDLFRMRSDAASSDFAAAERHLASGEDQRFVLGNTPIALSTGRPDGSGGDGRQAAHWKDRHLTGQYLGLMNPTIEPGEHPEITNNDVTALYGIGYRINSLLDVTTQVPLVSGQPQTSGMVAPPQGLGVISHTQFTIAVPRDAAQLKIELQGDQDVDLYVRYGQEVFISGFHPESDFVSKSETGSETIVIKSSELPALRQGIYFIAVANWGPGVTGFAVTATVTGGNHDSAPAVFNLSARLDGDALSLDYAALDRDGDFAMADVGLLDEAGHLLSSSRSAISAGTFSLIESQLQINGLSAMTAARRASLVLTDRAGNRSPEVTVDFSQPQTAPVGLTVKSASFNGAKLVLKVQGVVDDLGLEINGQLVARKIKVNGSGSKLTIKGDANQLNLRAGGNLIRVKNAQGWSSSFTLNL
jgi:hypothetical protein